ncbi:uncharacterized protein LOC120234013 [Hyaena hyaena]|uniref:uncharacterized protein LOC120234013 n=1 Tax=Hyaena hyaena TaxID=95912 RepID=UPI001924E7E0|nr:uncharacterized protein LOC120234013 [Hyaena hyaena]
MAEQPAQQQMKTSFLFIQLQAPPAQALPSQSPAAAAWTAAPGGPEEGHIFPSPRTGFLAGQDLRHTQGLAAPPSCLLQKGDSGTQEPAAFSCSALKEEREEKPQDLDVRRGGVCRSPRHRPSPAPASRKFGRLQPLSCRLPSPAPVMSNESSNPSMGWKHWPAITVPQDLWSMDPQSWDALGCSIPQTSLAHTTDRGESAMLRRGVATCQVLPKSCEEGTSTTVRARRARLYRYCPPIQTSKSYPALPVALPLKQLTGTPDQQNSRRKNNKNLKHKPHLLNWAILIP